MSCEDNRGLLHTYVDGELDLVRSLEIEKHLEGCKTCAQTVQNQQSLASAMRASSLYFRPPRELKPRVDAALRRSRKNIRWPLIALAAGLLLAGVSDVQSPDRHTTNTTMRQGYNLIHWTRDVNAADLETLADLLRQPGAMK